MVPVKEPLKSARIKGPGSDSSRRVGVSKTPDRKGPGIPPSKSPVRGPKLGFLEGGLAPPSKSPVRGPKLALLEGEELTVKKSGSSVMIVDAKGGSATVTIPNVNQSNGVIHVVDTVLMPAS